MEKVITPRFRLLYDGTDISADISANLISATYTDKVEFASDELEITVEDTEDLWKDAWFPEKGAKLTFDYGYDNNLVSAGEFEIDEIELSGPPDVVTIKALATGITKPTRTEISYAHENITLRKIAETIAGRVGLTVEGEIDDIEIKRVTQNRETDLSFLKRVSDEYGYLFSIRGTKLIFTKRADIEKSASVTAIDRTDISEWNIRDKTADTYQAAEVKYNDPATKELTVYRTESTDLGTDISYADIIKPDTLQIRKKVENGQQAKAIAEAALQAANSVMVEGSVGLFGNPILVAGSNFDLTGLRKLSGKYHIRESRHSFDRGGGYKTTLDVKRVALIDASLEAPKS